MIPLSPQGPSPSASRYGTVFLVTAIALTAFGVLMIYSASSIMALTSEATNHNPLYYAVRQLAFAVVGAVLAAVAWRGDYHLWAQAALPVVWGLTALGLVAVIATSAGQDAYGATRWIAIGPFSFQPSEFAKVTLLLAAAGLLQRFFEEGSLGLRDFLVRAALLVGIPLVLVLAQPDKGTVMVVGVTIVAMLALAGAPWRVVAALAAAGALGFVLLSLRDEYSRQRIVTMLDPWADPYGAGYQLIQGYYAFGSGGLFGVGVGMSRQKYSYLPMAHNDFIFAVIGEELGLVGTVALLLSFLLLLWLGLRIAQDAPDLSGRLIAAGGPTMLAVQLLLNVSGVLGIFPLSGKPIPFVSYGGSSIMSTLLIVGLVLSVSRTSAATRDDRAAWGGHRPHDGVPPSSRLRVIPGGARAVRGEGRASSDAYGTGSARLDPNVPDRLRGRGAGRGGRG